MIENIIIIFLLHFSQCSPFLVPLKNTSELVKNNGYPCQEYEVITEDGYILTIFRIPYGKNLTSKSNRHPVFLQHGILCSSDSWVISIPEKGLAYRLADSGYDVWIGNSRGNPYSKNHITLSVNNPVFWNFSFHEMGYYDLPATIDYVLNFTYSNTLTYIGHSEGTTEFFVMASTRPEYNKKIKVMSALAPVAFIDGTRGLARYLTHIAKFAQFAAKELGINEIFNSNLPLRIIDHLICNEHSLFLPLCEFFFNLIAGFDSPQLNKTLLETIGAYSPTGASVKQLMHYDQLVNSGDFAQYDYGEEENLLIYNSKTPPQYNLSLISSPVILHYGQNDYLLSTRDIARLEDKLQNPVCKLLVPYPLFNHIDFMWAIDVNKYLYDYAIELIKRFL